jgi:phage shock protein A
MSVMKRVSMMFRAKANKALDRMEDPRETLDYSYQTQLELLQKVRRGVADVATSRKRVELQINQLQQSSDKLDRQARDALGVRTRKETIKATYTAAEAQTRINEAFTGISEEMGDVGLAIQRAEDKTAQMQARAGAIDELMASGALDDMVSGPHDDIQAELDRMGAGHDVDAELARLKGELAPPSAPRQIEGAESADGAPADGAAGAVNDGQPPQAPADQPQAGDGA